MISSNSDLQKKLVDNHSDGGISGVQGGTSDLSPLIGYVNTAGKLLFLFLVVGIHDFFPGYPMKLNEDNCPNYPFCYWNPYGD